jgi:hypothetical protein
MIAIRREIAAMPFANRRASARFTATLLRGSFPAAVCNASVLRAVSIARFGKCIECSGAIQRNPSQENENAEARQEDGR